eukprot:6341656-Amphidinium_carterae.2
MRVVQRAPSAQWSQEPLRYNRLLQQTSLKNNKENGIRQNEQSCQRNVGGAHRSSDLCIPYAST